MDVAMAHLIAKKVLRGIQLCHPRPVGVAKIVILKVDPKLLFDVPGGVLHCVHRLDRAIGEAIHHFSRGDPLAIQIVNETLLLFAHCFEPDCVLRPPRRKFLKIHLQLIAQVHCAVAIAIVEQKTGKERTFTVPLVIQQYLENYALRNSIGRTERLFPITERAVQKQLALVCDYLGFEGISTHSFRKWYATEIYKNNGYDVALVQRLLQHSSASTTQRYIGIEPQRIEQAIEGHARLI
jgi:hypothetical protein